MTTFVDHETAAVNRPAASTRAGGLYRALWRWHFYAGLFVAPFIIMFSVTGLLYMFQPQIHSLLDGDKMYVEPQTTPVPYTQQVAAVEAAYPGAALTQVRPNRAPDRATEVLLTDAAGRELVVFVDPYTARVTGERDTGRDITELAITMHGDLLAGDTGDRILEIAAGWGVVLVVTGVYLWWPRSGSPVWGTLLPRLSRGNKRIFWRDLHAVPGFYLALVLLFLLMSGMTWTGVWGDRFANVWSYYPDQMWGDAPPSTQLSGSLNSTGAKIVPWAAAQLPLPLSSGAPAEHSDHAAHDAQSTATNGTTGALGGIPAGQPVNVDSVVALARSMNVAPTFVVSLPDGPEGVYSVTVSAGDFSGSDARDELTMHIDQYSGQVLVRTGWNDYGGVAQAVSMGIAIHEGKQFGVINQIVIVLACLVVIVLAATGVVLWWQRRPAGRLGAPAKPRQRRASIAAIAIMVVIGLMFPLVGVSLAAVLALDWLLISRVPVLKRALT